jgi:hypothetical protein
VIAESLAFNGREAQVDGISEENAGERIREDRRDTEGLEGERRLLAARTAAEVRAGDDQVTGLDFFGPRRIDGLERVLGEDLRVRGPEVLARDDVVRGDVVAEGPDATSEAGLQGPTPSAGP